MTQQFETGKTYTCRSVCDADCVWTFTVERRTAKTVHFRNHETGNVHTCRPATVGGEEVAKPLGNYSMCPVLRASSERAPTAQAFNSQGRELTVTIPQD